MLAATKTLSLPLVIACSWCCLPWASADEPKQEEIQVRVEIKNGEVQVEGTRNGEDMDEEELQKHVLRVMKQKNGEAQGQVILDLVGEVHGQQDLHNIILRSLDGENTFNWQAADGEKVIRLGDGQAIFVGQPGAPAGKYFLGVALEEVSDALRAHLDISEDQGVMVSMVVDDSPAEEAGIEAHDVVDGR